MAASRASIKRAVLAARLLRKTEESAADARDSSEDSKPAGAAEGFRGGSVASKIRIQKQLTSRSGSGGLSPSKSRSFEEETEAPDPGPGHPGLAGSRVGQDTGGHLRLEDLDDAAHRNKSQEAHAAPVFGGLAALKVKHRLQALHQEAKKKQPTLPSIGPANFSVTNATAADKISEVPVAAPSQNQAANSMAALVSAARTTLPKFAGATEEEAEIKSLLGEVDKDLLDALKEVSRSLTWLFNDSDTDFDNQLTYKQLKAGIQLSPVLPSFVSLRKLTAALGSSRSRILDNTRARDPAAGQTSCYKVACGNFHYLRAQLATRLWAATESSSRCLLAKSSLSCKHMLRDCFPCQTLLWSSDCRVLFAKS
ncbi:unnamed protein product [Symbiodinium sp. CCMP2592]|nr:unnamed protein product [Symbiodinium sp. CCMP2592]